MVPPTMRKTNRWWYGVIWVWVVLEVWGNHSNTLNIALSAQQKSSRDNPFENWVVIRHPWGAQLPMATSVCWSL